MVAPKKSPICSECGAVLDAGPGRCPLCGTEPRADAPAAVPADDYQAKVRELRKQLQELRRGGAEAV